MKIPKWYNVDYTCWEGEADSIADAVKKAIASGADLREAGLREADLQGAHLRGAGLQGANLQGVDLRGVDLQGAVIRRILQIGPIGSRGDYLVVWCMDDGTYRYSTGCQIQIAEEDFRSRVVATHNGNEHGRAYMEAIEFAHRICAIYHPPEAVA